MNIINSYLFRFFIIFHLFNLSISLSRKQRKEILNYLFDTGTSLINQNLKDEETFKPLTFLTEESQLFRDYIKASLDESKMADPNCIDNLISIYESNIFPTMKLIRDSSHSFYKLGSYHDCKYQILYDSKDESITSSNISYNYILFYNNPDIVDLRPILFSLCVPNTTDCRPKDYSEILLTFNTKTEFIDNYYIGGIETYIIDESKKKFDKDYAYIGFMVVGFFLIILLCGFFPGIPVFLFKCCFKKSLSKNMDVYETSALIQLEKAFDIKESISEIYSRGIGYDSGISFIKGLRGIFLLFFIFGNTLENVYQYPLKKDFNKYFNDNFLSFLFFFNRCSKSVFLSLSAFTLCFKILCFFDNEIERNELKNFDIKLEHLNPDVINNSMQDERMLRKKNRNKKRRKSSEGSPNSSKLSPNSNSSPENSQNINNTKKNSLSGSNLGISSSKMSNASKSISGDLSKMPLMSKFNSAIAEIKFDKLSFKSFLTFFFRQFYKYFLFILIVLFYRYFYYDLVSLTTENPMWEFIRNSYINKLSGEYICSIIFLYFPFYMEANDKIQYDFFDIIILEISLFIIFSLVLFLFYKKNFSVLRLDIFLIILFFLGLISKIATYYIILAPKIGQKDVNVYDDYFYPTKGFTNKKYKLILNNPLYFFASFSIGLFFGLVNYAIQKSAKNINDFRDKLYLTIPIWFLNKIKRRALLYAIIFFIVFITYFVWCGFSYKALFISDKKLEEDAKANGFFDNQIINIYYSIDIDIFIFFLYIALIPFILMGENIVISFLEHDFWNIFSRPYFSFMLLVQTVGNNIIYRMNTNVNNDILTIFFFAVINIISSIIFGMLIYILLEAPLKKINKFIFRRKEKEEDINDKIEENEKEIKLGEKEEKDDDEENKILIADL